MKKHNIVLEIKKTKLQIAYEELTNVSLNKSIDSYDKFRRVFSNFNSPPNFLKIASAEDLQKDEYIFEQRKINKELNQKWQTVTGIGSIALGIGAIIELAFKE